MHIKLFKDNVKNKGTIRQIKEKDSVFKHIL